ncbi:MAG: branched-chain amino acid ABC transporter permease [Synergistaceae bacterium]|jgi:branched-chain amino acid transport system permease protein|nr:branched-chain amino acid ABC transporter permease [Synergistaceae bacterium]
MADMENKIGKKMDTEFKLWLGLLAFLALLAVIPGAIGNAFHAHVLVLILLYASMAQSWNILGGYCGQVSFGHSVFFGIGAYGAAMAMVKFTAAPWLGVITGAVLASLVSVLISWPCFKLRGHYFAIATFAVVEIFGRLFLVWDWIGGALGLDYPIMDDSWKYFLWSSDKTGYYTGAVALFAFVFGVVRIVEKRRLGFYMRAVREGQETAESLGVNSTKVKLTAMALSAFFAALCGAFFAQYNYRVDPPMVVSLDMSMKFVLITILGGMGTFWGPLLGAAVLIPLQEYTRTYLASLGPGVDQMIYGLLIIFMMVRQPKGIMGFLAEVGLTGARKDGGRHGDGGEK